MKLIRVGDRIINLEYLVDALETPNGSLTLFMATADGGVISGSAKTRSITLHGPEAVAVRQSLQNQAEPVYIKPTAAPGE